MSDEHITQVRMAFLKFFMEPLKYVPSCFKKSVKTDFDSIFDKQQYFRQLYQS